MKIKIKMKCRDCGHEQVVHGVEHDGRRYFGSGYDFCDECDGVPHVIDGSLVTDDDAAMAKGEKG